MQRQPFAVLGLEGVPVSGVTVTVYQAGTLSLASIYSDNGTTAKANPFTNDANGSFEFYAPNGRYDIVLSKTGLTFDALDTKDVLFWDPTDVPAGGVGGSGLYIRTHPDADKAAAQIYLARADVIALQDGSGNIISVGPWDRLAADITQTGAGGRDAGSITGVAAWFEKYAIRKGGDGTKALLLHRAKDYFLDEDSSSGEDGGHILRSGATTNVQLGQEIQVDTAGPLEIVELKLLRSGTITGNVWLEVRNDSGGVPGTTVLATSDKIKADRIHTSAHWVPFFFRNPATLTAATSYHLVLVGDYTPSGTNCITWRADTTAGGYRTAAISKAAYNGTTWTADTDDDFIFKAYITRNESAVVMPSGYDQKALLGYAFYDDGGGGFKEYAQVDRHVITAFGTPWKAKVLAAGPVLDDLAAYVPPRPLMVEFAMGNSAGANGFVMAPSTYMTGDPVTTDTEFTAHAISVGGQNVPTHRLRPFVEYQRIVSGGADGLWVAGWRY